MSDFWKGKDPCWVILDCSKFLRQKCPAFTFPAIPCWEVAYTQNEVLLGIKRDCKSCKVYKLYHDILPSTDLDSDVSSSKIPR